MCDPNEEQQWIGREVIRSDINMNNATPNHFGVKHNDFLVLSFLVIKNCNENRSQNEMKFTEDEIDSIFAWLDSPKTPKELTVFEGDENKTSTPSRTHYFGLFTDVQPYTHSGYCYGMYLKFTCNAPYGFSDEHIESLLIGSGSSINYNNKSSELEEYLSPFIRIYCSDTLSETGFSGNEKITITNDSDSGKSMVLTMPKSATAIFIDCKKCIIKDQSDNICKLDDVGINFNTVFGGYSISRMYWLRLLPGENNIQISTENGQNIKKIEIGARFIRKSGGFIN